MGLDPLVVHACKRDMHWSHARKKIGGNVKAEEESRNAMNRIQPAGLPSRRALKKSTAPGDGK